MAEPSLHQQTTDCRGCGARLDIVATPARLDLDKVNTIFAVSCPNCLARVWLEVACLAGSPRVRTIKPPKPK